MAASFRRSPLATAGIRWRVLSATARGASHVANGLPNQDAEADLVCEGPGGPTVVAVADGHGHRRHFRSDTGSDLAVRAALVAGKAFASGVTVGAKDADVEELARSVLVPGILDRWRGAVAADIANRPFSPEERAALDAAGDGPEVPYGSTLLSAVVDRQWMVCLQIGDGDLVAIAPDGQSSLPLPADPLLDGYHTTSLCQAEARQLFRVGVIDLLASPPLALVLATDGYGNAQAADPWEPAFSVDLVSVLHKYGLEWLSGQVPLWVERCASSQGSADDTTLALLVNTSSVGDSLNALTTSTATTVPNPAS
jgi:hypothetical protein